MIRSRTFASAVVCLLVWLMLAAAFPASASAASSDDTSTAPTDRLSALSSADPDQRGVRLSAEPVGSATGRGFEPSGAVAHALGFRAGFQEVRCDLYPEHESCSGRPQAEAAATPVPTPTPTPSPTPTPTPDPRIYEADAYDEALKQAKEWVSTRKPSFTLWPDYEQQVVGLESFLWIADEGWQEKSFEDTVSGVTVTVKATPFESNWHFKEQTTNGTVAFTCPGRGDKYTTGELDAACGRTYEHSSSVTGPVDLTTTVGYRLTVVSSLADSISNFVDGETVESPVLTDELKQVLTVLEVLSFGFDTERGPAEGATPRPPRTTHPETVDCGWLLGGLLSIVGVSCETAHGAYNLLKSGVAECGGALIGSVKDTLTTLKELVTNNPITTIQDGIAGITELISLAQEDPEKFAQVVTEGAIGISLEEWNKADRNERINLVIGAVCEKALEIITGKAFERVFEIIKRGDGNGPGGETPDTDAPDTDAPDVDPDADRPDVDPDGDNPDVDPDGDTPDGDNDPDGDSDPDRDNDDEDPDRDDEDDDPDDEDEDSDEEEEEEQPGCEFASFATGTRVLMADGDYVAIDQIHAGDRVMSYNFETTMWEPKAVLAQWSLVDREPAATLTLHDDSQAVATADHLFWVETTQEWTEIQDVTIGHDFLTPAGTAELAHVTLSDNGPWTVWELTVEDNHNFAIVVGDTAVLVHNADDRTCEPDDSHESERNRQKKEELEEHAAAERDRIGRETETLAGKRNVAVSELELDGGDTISSTGVSGETDLTSAGAAPQVGDDPVFDLDPSKPRPFDSERKILEDLAEQLGPADPDGLITGTLDIFTERPPCASCGGIIEQFKARYPGIEVNVYYADG